MKKTYSISSLLILMIIAVVHGHGQYVTLAGKQFKDKNGKDFFPLVCNYLVQYVYKDHDTSKLFLTPDASVDGWCFNCKDTKSCLDEMSRNFAKIRDMGFNAIRIMGSNPNYYCKRGVTEAWKIKAFDLDAALKSSCDRTSSEQFHEYFFSGHAASNPTAQMIFASIDSILVRAGNAGLYVILVLARGEGDYSTEYPDHYADYLRDLAKHIHSVTPKSAREALMAYDIDNEPSISWNQNTMWPVDTVGQTKQDIYENVKLFNKRLKKADPDHLTTLGGRGIGEIFEYDLSILSIDFYSLHLYPLIKSYDFSSFQNMLDRVQGQLIWVSNVLPIPWIIGETGFRSQPGSDGPDGTNEEQKEYAEKSLEMTKFYGGSGYSWWNYEDYNWNKNDCFYGLTYWDKKNNALAEKPVVDVFRNFNTMKSTPVFPVPGNYRDPYNHGHFNPDRNYMTGHVQNQDGRPIKDAYIVGWTPISMNATGKPVYEAHYTFSDENGNFTLIPYNSDPADLPKDEIIVEVRATAPGYSRFKSGWFGDGKGVPPERVKVITLVKLQF